jgi:hypothetical protein
LLFGSSYHIENISLFLKLLNYIVRYRTIARQRVSIHVSANTLSSLWTMLQRVAR